MRRRAPRSLTERAPLRPGDSSSMLSGRRPHPEPTFLGPTTLPYHGAGGG